MCLLEAFLAFPKHFLKSFWPSPSTLVGNRGEFQFFSEMRCVSDCLNCHLKPWFRLIAPPRRSGALACLFIRVRLNAAASFQSDSLCCPEWWRCLPPSFQISAADSDFSKRGMTFLTKQIWFRTEKGPALSGRFYDDRHAVKVMVNHRCGQF